LAGGSLRTFSTPNVWRCLDRKKKKKMSFFIRNESNREQLLSRKFSLVFWGFFFLLLFPLPNRQPPRDSTAIIIITKERSPPTIRYVILDVSSLSFVVPGYSFGSTSFTLTNFVFFVFFYRKMGNGNLN
jgi:hypothetical protein